MPRTPNETPRNNYPESNFSKSSNGVSINQQKSRINPSAANSIITSSTYRSQTAPSIYETAANSVDTDIILSRTKEVTSPSLIYSATNFDSIVGTGTISDIYGDPTRRPLLSPQNSILALKPTIWQTYNNENSMMQVSNKIAKYCTSEKNEKFGSYEGGYY